jgi:hypothetical protein
MNLLLSQDGVLVPDALGFAKLVYEHTLGDVAHIL